MCVRFCAFSNGLGDLATKRLRPWHVILAAAATAATATKKAFAEREVSESVAAATRESIRGGLLQYYEMYDVDFDPVTARTYFNHFPGRNQAVLEALLSLHAMGMQASIHIDLPYVMNKHGISWKDRSLLI